MGSIANGFAHLGIADFGIIIAILVMDMAMSGDNALAINAMVMHLPEKIRGKAIWFGMLLAAGLRVVALALANFIMANPWVKILGALYLIKLCYGHFSSETEEEAGVPKLGGSFLGALIAIGFLDLSLSLDNVVAVVAMSQNLAIIVTGVLSSIALLAIAAQVIRRIMTRYPDLEGAAYVILGYLGVTMLADHWSEFMFWFAQKIGDWHNVIASLHYHMSDRGEMACVGLIILSAVVRGEIRRYRSGQLKVAPAKGGS